jgi:hypothetical protein
MTDVLDDDARTALHEILTEPSLPVGTAAAGPGGPRAARLREAIDHLVSLRLLAAGLHAPGSGRRLLAALEQLDPELAGALLRHVELVEVLLAVPPAPARDAVLGDVGRGDVLTWASEVRSWTWAAGRAPTPRAPLGSVAARLVVEEFPGLHGHVLAREPDRAALVVVPTHRPGVSWAPDGAGWLVTLDRVTVHVHELVDGVEDPR